MYFLLKWEKTVFNLFFQFLLPPTPSSNNQDFCPLATNRKNGIFDLHCNQMSLDSIFLAPKPFQKVNYQHSGHFSRWRDRVTFLDTDSQKEMKITSIITGKHSSGNDFLVKLGVAILQKVYPSIFTTHPNQLYFVLPFNCTFCLFLYLYHKTRLFPAYLQDGKLHVIE